MLLKRRRSLVVKFTLLILIFYFFIMNLTQSDPLDEEKEAQKETEVEEEDQEVREDNHDIKDKIILQDENIILKDDEKVLEKFENEIFEANNLLEENEIEKIRDDSELNENKHEINNKEVPEKDNNQKDEVKEDGHKKEIVRGIEIAAEEDSYKKDFKEKKVDVDLNNIVEKNVKKHKIGEEDINIEDDKEKKVDINLDNLSEKVDKKQKVEERRVEVKKDKEKEKVPAVVPAPDGPGELGKPVKMKDPDPETKKKIDAGWKLHAFNQYVSDQISVHRSLPDKRDSWCRETDRLLPLSQLPSTSVIICFHNEAWSALLRTVHSVLDRSPGSLLQEIILVDDASEHSYLQSELEEYMAQYSKVRIIRLKERVGLIRARLAGASHSHSDSAVLTYLDSHCECMDGWLEPLLDRIARDPTRVVCPVIDILNDDTLAYQFSGYLAVGGFDWNLVFNWHTVPVREMKRKSHSWAPTHSPTMAGGLFSIDRKFFEKLGTYDPGFDIWGGENLELSFKTWMCGGTLEIIPCSHVGHIFRKRSPYKWRSNVNVLKKNTVRLAEVWLDEYKEYYYQRNGRYNQDFGDITSRKQLREGLKCKSFKWYLANVYPEMFVPSEALANGVISNPASGVCVDAPSGAVNLNKEVRVWPCHGQGGNQYWMFSKTGEIRRDDTCLDCSGHHVKLQKCHGSRGNQWWYYNTREQSLRHPASRKCLAVSADSKKLVMEQCSVQNTRQRWQVEHFDLSKLSKDTADVEKKDDQPKQH